MDKEIDWKDVAKKYMNGVPEWDDEDYTQKLPSHILEALDKGDMEIPDENIPDMTPLVQSWKSVWSTARYGKNLIAYATVSDGLGWHRTLFWDPESGKSVYKATG